jgi:hypothetical protein
MPTLKVCSFYKNSDRDGIGRGIGYCDLDCGRTTCTGDIHFCKKPNALRKHFLEQKKREGSSVWQRKIKVPFLGLGRLD